MTKYKMILLDNLISNNFQFDTIHRCIFDLNYFYLFLKYTRLNPKWVELSNLFGARNFSMRKGANGAKRNFPIIWNRMNPEDGASLFSLRYKRSGLEFKILYPSLIFIFRKDVLGLDCLLN